MRQRVGGLARRLVRVGRRGTGRVVRTVGRVLPMDWSSPGVRLLEASGLFDRAYYLAGNPDVAAARVDPVRHYLRHGAREGRDPHPLFDTSYYLAGNPDVAASGVNPLVHYLRHGAREGRDPHPLFDTSYYVEASPEVGVSGINPLVHFVRQGAREGRRPHPLVDAAALAEGGWQATPVVEFVPDHLLEWREGAAVFGRRLGVGGGGQELRALAPGADLEFTAVLPAAPLVALRLTLGPVSGPEATALLVQLHPEGVSGPVHEVFVPLTARDTAGRLVADLRSAPVPAGRRGRIRLTVRGPEGSALVLVGAQTWTGRAVAAPVMLRAADDAPVSLPAGPPLTLALSPQFGDGGLVQDYLVGRFSGVPLHLLVLDSATRVWSELEASQVVVLANPWSTPPDLLGGLDELAFALWRAGVVTVLLDVDRHAIPSRVAGSAEPAIGRAIKARDEAARRCHYAVRLSPEGRDAVWSAPGVPDLAGDAATASLAELRAAALRPRLASVAIVAILYRKAAVVERFLEMICRQSYQGPVTVVLVDDASPEDDVARAEAYRARRGTDWPSHVTLRIVRNTANLGNCLSRNRGLAAVAADIYVVIDADCLMNREFVAAHVEEHALPPTGVVIGPLNIESGDRDPMAVVHHLEAHPEEVEREAGPQDPLLPSGFLNCITRNFSIHRRHLPASGLFDEAFGYSAHPDSGFGWEDVEMGYRLYQAGVVVTHTPRAFAVHATHSASLSEDRQCVGSARNFERLFTTHPDLALVARRWATETAGKIGVWADANGVGEDPAVVRVRERFTASRTALAPYLRAREGRRLRILSYRWHVPHQYELQKLPHDFTLVTGLGEGMTDVWSFDQRPLRPNVRFLPWTLVRPGDYDAAILHFDENCLAPDLGNGVLSPDWGTAFRHFLVHVRLPTIAVCHGTPQFRGQYGLVRQPLAKMEVLEAERRWLVGALREAMVVVNSWQARDEWGFARSTVIWHGFDPQEFPPGTHQRQVLSHGEDRWRVHYRGAHALARVRELLGEGIRVDGPDHQGAALRPRGGNAFAVAQFRAYVDWIRAYTVYLNTTLRSPMPRSRGEAMMCGVIPVSYRNHDVEHFVRHGVNGFYGDTPEELAEYVRFLVRDATAAHRIGIAARRTALDLFNHDRYLSDWSALLDQVAR